MEGFATGFNLEGTTKPGFSIENQNFKITFSGVFCDKRKNIVSHGFERCYDWSKVMEMALNATEDFDSMIEVEEKTENVLRTWLTSFHGWGLLSSMLPIEIHRYFILSLAYTSANWNEATGGPYSTQKIFDTVKFVYENCPGKEIKHLVPRLGVWFDELVEDDLASEANERKKSFTLFFSAKWMLEVKFVFEKKRVNTNLLDFAAEEVAKHIKNDYDIEDLEMPLILFDKVYDKFKDAEWVRSYWNFKTELEEDKSEIDEEDFAKVLQEADIALDEEAKAEGNQAIVSSNKVNKDVKEEFIDDTELVISENIVKEIVSNKEDSNPDISRSFAASDTCEEASGDLVSSWGALYFFLLIFAFLCL